MTNRATAALLICLLGTPAIAVPAQEPVTYPLITNGNIPTYQIVVTGGSYVLDISGTFGGSTLALVVTTNGVTSEYQSWLSAPAIIDRPCFNIPSGSIVRATLTGGTPSGMNVTLGGVGAGGCATGSSAEVEVDFNGEVDITAVGGNPVTDEIPTHDADLLAAMASEVPAGDEEIGKTTPTITNLISGTITSDMTGTTSTSLVAAPGDGLTNYITHIGCSNMDADTDTVINLQDGNGGTTFYHGVAAKLGGGFSYTLSPPLKQPTANTALYVANVTTGATTRCSASGFKR